VVNLTNLRLKEKKVGKMKSDECTLEEGAFLAKGSLISFFSGGFDCF
jgi:hypothetical protein